MCCATLTRQGHGRRRLNQREMRSVRINHETLRQRRRFSKLPTLENGDVDFDKVPDHLQDLYNKSVELLNAPQKKILSKLFYDYEDVFAKDASDIGRAKDIKHHIDTGTEEPVHQRPRRQPKAHAEDLQRQVKLADCGVIRPSEREWTSNVIMARKTAPGGCASTTASSTRKPRTRVRTCCHVSTTP